MKIGWALDMIGWACAQPFPTLATPLRPWPFAAPYQFAGNVDRRSIYGIKLGLYHVPRRYCLLLFPWVGALFTLFQLYWVPASEKQGCIHMKNFFICRCSNPG